MASGGSERDGEQEAPDFLSTQVVFGTGGGRPGVGLDVLATKVAVDFQGLTSDGKYNVAAFFPITHPSLPADDKNAETVIGADFIAYRDATVKALNDAADSSFSPEIATFDRMLQSLKVK